MAEFDETFDLVIVGSGCASVTAALAAVAASAAYAFYTVLGAKLVDDGHHATDALAASFSLGAVILLPFLAIDYGWLMTPAGLAVGLWLGAVSYSLYLWHWPLLAALRIARLGEEPPPAMKALAIVAAIVLAELTWRFVERGFRFRPTSAKTAALAAALGAPVHDLGRFNQTLEDMLALLHR